MLGQDAATVPLPSVAVENTNAAFSSTGVAIPQANPARPTVTTPANIPPTGFLQFEQGLGASGELTIRMRGQIALSQATKISVTTRLLVSVFLTASYTYSTLGAAGAPASHSSDPGDLQAGVQAVVHKAIGPLPTISLGLIRRVRSGTSANIDLGAYSQSALLQLGGDLPKGIHYDSNIVVDEQNNGRSAVRSFSRHSP